MARKIQPALRQPYPTGTPMVYAAPQCEESRRRQYEVAIDRGEELINMWIDGDRSMSYPLKARLFIAKDQEMIEPEEMIEP
jgi:hypothetical protein